MLRMLVDPNRAELRATPKTEDDLLIAATNGRVVAFDAVSQIDPSLADALCRVATGAGFGKRNCTRMPMRSSYRCAARC